MPGRNCIPGPSAQIWQPAIEDYGVIGDCRTAVLISRAGSVGWLCLPDFSSPSVFAEILDRSVAGQFSIKPHGEFKTTRRYADKTPVLETTLEGPQGAVRLTDVVPVLDGAESLQPMREILRIMEGLSGELDLEICIEPRPNYGRTKSQARDRGRLGWSYSCSNELLSVRSDVPLSRAGEALQASVRIRAGERVCLSPAT